MNVEDFKKEWFSDKPDMELRTSGSTGVPKTVHALKSRMLASAARTCDFLNLKPGDRALLCLSPDYIAGKMMIVRSIERKLRLVCVEASNHPFASVPDGEEPFHLAAMVPSQVYCTLSSEREASLLRATRNLIIGGGAVNEDLALRLKDFPNAVWSTYGMTETLSHIALRRLNGEDRSEWYEVMEGVSLHADTDGCLVVEAPDICDGALHTNDIVEFKPGSALRMFKILGRKDNVICSGGMKLQIETLEEELRKFLDLPFCISSRQDPKFGEIAVLLAVKERSRSNAAGESDDEFLRQIRQAVGSLGRFSRPRDIVIVDSLPLTATGKIDRVKARELCAI